MSADWYKKLPQNRNYLTPTGFTFRMERFDGVDFFCQSANIPDVTMPVAQVATPFRSIPIIPGGGVEYGDLSLRFIVDEDLKNYASIWNWIRDNGNASSFEGETSGYSDAQLTILTSNFNPQFIINFEKLIPVALTQLPFDASLNDTEFFTATATFKYFQYTLNDMSLTPL
jgi:hypothetical protein